MSFESDIADYFKENNDSIASKLIGAFVIPGVIENKMRYEMIRKVDGKKFELSICLKELEE